MSWNDFYARRDVMDVVLTLARRDPAGPLPFAEVDRAEELFASPERLLQALYHRWLQRLTGYLRADVVGPEDAATVPEYGRSDFPDRVAAAWRKCHAENPTLRAVLDAGVECYPDALAPSLDHERRTIAIAAGLAGEFEPADEIAQVGAGFLAMVRHADTPAGARRSPIGQLLRLLSPAG